MARTTMLSLRPLSLAFLAAASLTGAAHAAFPMGDTQIGFGGYLKLDAMLTQSTDGVIATGIGRDFYVPSLIPVGGSSNAVAFDMHARQSRFWFTTETALDNGQKVNGRFEFDMMSTTIGDQRVTNGYSPEIRHAYLNYGKWTVGQTWSTFMDTNALPDSLDFIGGTDGAIFVRQGLVRYTEGNWQFAAENPTTTATAVGGATRVTADFKPAPDLVGRYNFKTDAGAYSVAVLVRDLAIKQPQGNDHVLGYGVSVSGKANCGQSDELRFTLNAGKGIGRYMSLNTANDAALTPGGGLKAIGASGLMLAWKHAWNPQWRSNLILAAETIDNPVALTGKTQTSATRSATVNLIHQLASKLSVGVETRYAARELENGQTGGLLRVQSSLKYDF